MVLMANNYADFKTILNTLGSLLSGLSVFHHTESPFWSVWAIRPLDGNGVTLTLSTGQPGSFSTDFPAAVALTSTMSMN